VRSASECLAAGARQLDVGNWPDECWQEAHTFSLGYHIAAELHTMAAAAESAAAAAAAVAAAAEVAAAAAAAVGAAATRNDITAGCSSSSDRGGVGDAHLTDEAAAAAELHSSVERWSPEVKLGRVALEALSMASLATYPAAIPPWLGAAILLAERACVATLPPSTARTPATGDGDRGVAEAGAGAGSEARVGAVAGAGVIQPAGIGECGGQGRGEGGDDKDATIPPSDDDFMIPDTVPRGAPVVSPARAVARVAAADLTVAHFYSRFVATVGRCRLTL